MASKKFENIIIASDIDGTYLGDESRIVPRNDEYIKYFKENGGHFTIATGRTPYFTLRAIPHIAELCNLPVVTTNGSCLYDFANAKALDEYYVDNDVAKELADYVKANFPEVGVRATVGNTFVATDIENPHIRRDLGSMPEGQAVISPTDTWKSFKISKLAVRGAAEDMERVGPILVERYKGRLEMSLSSAVMLDVQAEGRSKAAMLLELVEREFTAKGKKAMLCTVGDYDNDLKMHSVADLSVCPANAAETVKGVCKLQLCDHDKGVIADLIEYLDKTV